MSRIIVLPPASEELAARQARAHGQSVEEYLSTLLTDALARRAAEEPPDAGPDPLGFREQEMDRRRPEPPG